MKTTKEALQFPLLLAQIFGLKPIDRFGKFKFIHCIINLALILIKLCFYLIEVSSNKITLHTVVSLKFGFGCLATSFVFLKLSIIWPKKISPIWMKVDRSMAGIYGFPVHLKRNINLITIAIFFATAMEQIFFLMYTVSKKDHDFLRTDYVFQFVPFTLTVAIISQISNIFSAFSFNYLDFFIMIISYALAARFAQVKRRILKTKHINDNQYWMQTRINYNNLYLLTKKVDCALAKLILISFANNLIHILVQLLNTLKPLNGGIFHQVYFTYSFSFLLIRTALVVLFADKIYCESTESGKILSRFSAQAYNTEIAGAIVTYELILLQFYVH